MSKNILITGAAGYIGGSVLEDFLSRTSDPIKTAKIFAAVRSQEQVETLSKLEKAKVLLLDISNETAVNEAVLRNEIDIVIQTTPSYIPSFVSNIINALGQRRKISGKETYYIHTSVTTLFSKEGGWPFGEVKDTDAVFEKEKQMEPGHPVRDNNILVVDLAKSQGITSFNVVVPTVYGRGTGQWRKLSVNIPAYVRTSIAEKSVYKFDRDASPPAVHISDLVAFYALLVEKILQKEIIPSGGKGYYFAFAHRAPWWAVMDRIARSLHNRGLVSSSEVQVWSSYEVAANALGFPVRFIDGMAMSSGDLIPVNAYQLGWQPKWDEKRFLGSIDDEVQAVQELDTKKTSIFDALLTPENR